MPVPGKRPLKDDQLTDRQIWELRRIQRRASDFTGPDRRLSVAGGRVSSGTRSVWFWLRWQFPIVLVAIALLFVSYNARKDQASQSNRADTAVLIGVRNSCRRGMADRRGNVESWYGAYLARSAQARKARDGTKVTDERAAAVYLWNVETQIRHLNRPHSLTWPLNSRIYPLGLSNYSCNAAFPKPPTVHASFWGIFG